MVEQIITKSPPRFNGIAECTKYPGLKATDWMRVREQVVADLGFVNKRLVCMGEHS